MGPLLGLGTSWPGKEIAPAALARASAEVSEAEPVPGGAAVPVIPIRGFPPREAAAYPTGKRRPVEAA